MNFSTISEYKYICFEYYRQIHIEKNSVTFVVCKYKYEYLWYFFWPNTIQNIFGLKKKKKYEFLYEYFD